MAAVKIATKPLQAETLLGHCFHNLETRQLSSPYPTVPSPIPYDILFSHDTCVTDNRQRNDMIVPKARFNSRSKTKSHRSIHPIILPRSVWISHAKIGHYVQQEAQLALEKADRTAYIWSQKPNFQSRRESDFSEVRRFRACYVNGTLLSKATNHAIILIRDGYFSSRRFIILIMLYWELCQHWKTIRLLLLALNMMLPHLIWQLNRLYGVHLQCHRSLCWCDITLSVPLSILVVWVFLVF